MQDPRQSIAAFFDSRPRSSSSKSEQARKRFQADVDKHLWYTIYSLWPASKFGRDKLPLAIPVCLIQKYNESEENFFEGRTLVKALERFGYTRIDYKFPMREEHKPNKTTIVVRNDILEAQPELAENPQADIFRQLLPTNVTNNWVANYYKTYC